MADDTSPGPEQARTPEGDSLIGTVLAGRYRLVKLLGWGAMGAVYVGEHLKIGRRDAIKVLRSSLSRDAEAVARFTRGARNASRIRHPNVCTVYDFSDTSDGLQFLAMELVEGESLSDLLRREGPLPPDRAARIILQAAAALEAAHDLGIVHRDLKPDNIMIAQGRDGRDIAKVVDFDIAKGSAEGEEKGVTRLGYVVGTPEYMSPEQLTGDPLDGRSDIYSLALVFFRMIAGDLPYRAKSTQELMMDRLTRDPLKLEDVAPGTQFSPALQSVMDHALARLRENRPATARDFGRELSDAVFGRPARSGAASDAAASESAAAPPTQLPPTVVAPRGGPTEAPSPIRRLLEDRRRLVYMGGAAVGLVAVGGIVVALMSSGGGKPARLEVPSTLAVMVGDSAPVNARVLDSHGTEITGADVRWTSTSPDVASVDGAGVVRGLREGTTSVRVVAGSASGSTTVTVSAQAAAEAPQLGVDSLSFVAPADGTRPAARSVDVSGSGAAGRSLTTEVSYPTGSAGGWLSARLEGTAPPTSVVVDPASPPSTPGHYRATVTVAWDGGGPASSMQVALDVERAQPPKPKPRPPTTRAWSTPAEANALAWRQLSLVDNAKTARTWRAMQDTTRMLWDATELADSIRARAAYTYAQAASALGDKARALTWAQRAAAAAPDQRGYQTYLRLLQGGGSP